MEGKTKEKCKFSHWKFREKNKTTNKNCIHFWVRSEVNWSREFKWHKLVCIEQRIGRYKTLHEAKWETSEKKKIEMEKKLDASAGNIIRTLLWKMDDSWFSLCSVRFLLNSLHWFCFYFYYITCLLVSYIVQFLYRSYLYLVEAA